MFDVVCLVLGILYFVCACSDLFWIEQQQQQHLVFFVFFFVRVCRQRDQTARKEQRDGRRTDHRRWKRQFSCFGRAPRKYNDVVEICRGKWHDISLCLCWLQALCAVRIDAFDTMRFLWCA